MSYDDWNSSANIADLVGKVFTRVTATDEQLVFENDTDRFVFYHSQDCCERVYIESIVGDLSDLENEVILKAVDEDNLFDIIRNADKETEDDEGSDTWTFYKFATRKGYVDVRWYGTSNGYYSEGVSIGYETV